MLLFLTAALLCVSVMGNAQTIITSDATIFDASYAQGIEVREGVTPPTQVTILAGASFPEAVGPAVNVFDTSRILIQGGDIYGGQGGLWLHDRSEAMIDGGTVRGFSALWATDESRLRFRNGSVHGWAGLFLDEHGQAVIEGGDIHGLVAASVLQSAVLNMYGGMLQGENAAMSVSLGGVVNIYGGFLRSDLNRAIVISRGGTVNVFGTDLVYDPKTGLLTGNLARGGAIEGVVQVRDGGILHLASVPESEASTLLIVLSGSWVLLRRKGKAAQQA